MAYHRAIKKFSRSSICIKISCQQSSCVQFGENLTCKKVKIEKLDFFVNLCKKWEFQKSIACEKWPIRSSDSPRMNPGCEFNHGILKFIGNYFFLDKHDPKLIVSSFTTKHQVGKSINWTKSRSGSVVSGVGVLYQSLARMYPL